MEDDIDFLEKFYLCAFSDKEMLKSRLQSDALLPLDEEVQKKILNVTIYNKVCKAYPPPDQFKKMFLRTLFDAVESYGSEPTEKLISEYAKILTLPANKNIGYCTYLIKKNCTISLQEDRCFVARGTTGLVTWDASKYLSEWCLRNSSIFKDKIVLELGSGVGLLGLVVCKYCQPNSYIFSDKHRDVMKVLCSNIGHNQPLTCSMRVYLRFWSDMHEIDVRIFNPDIILGADIVYDTSTLEDLIHALKLLLTNESCAYIASKIRNPETQEKFITLLGLSNLSHRILENEQNIFIYQPLSDFVLYEISRNKNSQ